MKGQFAAGRLLLVRSSPALPPLGPGPSSLHRHSLHVRRRCSTLHRIQTRPNVRWMQDDISHQHHGHFDRRTSLPHRDHDESSLQLWQQQHGCDDAAACLRQQHDVSSPPRRQQYDNNGTSAQLHDQQHDHQDTSSQLCPQHDGVDPSFQLPTQHNHNSAPAWLWQQQEREQILLSFSSRTSLGPTDDEGVTGSNQHSKVDLLLSLCRQGCLDKAVDMLFCMDSAASTYVYLSLLGLCSKIKLIPQAVKIYAHFGQYCAEFTDLMVEYLVVVVSKRNPVEHIRQQTSFTLPCLNVFSWTAMIAALGESGHGQEALILLQQMLEDGVEPSSYTFVSLIKTCSIRKDLLQGQKLHTVACMKGFASHLILASTLVSMYGKCEAIQEAENMFTALCNHDVVSCNAMLTAYLDHSQGDKALLLYRQMHDEGIRANQGTFVTALQACRFIAEVKDAHFVTERELKIISLEIGQAIHADARRNGFASDVYINNTIVTMYGKIGALIEAECVFVTLSRRDVVSWNAMLSTYVENNQGKKALLLYRMMVQEDARMDVLTFVFALQACCSVAEEEEQAVMVNGKTIKRTCLNIGQALHFDACMMAFTSDLFLGTTLLSMYGMCGALLEAEDVFVALSERDVVSWNAMISAYIEQDHGEKALKLFRQMQEESVGASAETLVFALLACTNLTGAEEVHVVKGQAVKAIPLEIGQALHGIARRKGFVNTFVCNTLVNMYGKCGTILKAEAVFAALSQPEIISWNALLSAFVEQGQLEKALQLYRQMHVEGIMANQLSFVFALQACSILADKGAPCFVKGHLKRKVALEIGSALHKDACEKGFMSDAYVGNTLLSMYGKCGAVLQRDNVFKTLLHRDIVAWNAMLSIYVEGGQAAEALQLYRQLQGQCIILDDVTLICVLQVCSTTGNLELCEQLHFNIVSAGYEQCLTVTATLIYAYGGCASMVDMKALFHELLHADTVAWNACIAAHLGDGESASSVRVFEGMKQTDTQPDEVTLASVLSACSHDGLVVDGLKYFETMRLNFYITPNLKHYGAMADLFGRAGDFKRLERLVQRMPMEADMAIRQCVMGACRKHGNLELAEWAFDHAVSLQPNQATAYVLMSNIYANDNWPLDCEA